jgi:hypothetical protein
MGRDIRKGSVFSCWLLVVSQQMAKRDKENCIENWGLKNGNLLLKRFTRKFRATAEQMA